MMYLVFRVMFQITTRDEDFDLRKNQQLWTSQTLLLFASQDLKKAQEFLINKLGLHQDGIRSSVNTSRTYYQDECYADPDSRKPAVITKFKNMKLKHLGEVDEYVIVKVPEGNCDIAVMRKIAMTPLD